MLGSIYIGLSGMNAYTKGLQAISNNVANLNTSGFKASSVSFSDVYNEGGDGQTFVDDENSQKSGQGVRYSGGGIDFSQGDMQQTNGDLDLAVQGSSFLLLKSADQAFYATTGHFAVDPDGFVSLEGTKNHLAVLDASGQPVAASVQAKATNPPVATTKITFSGNVSSTGSTATVSNITAFDSTGASHVWTIAFAADTTTPGQWNLTVTDATGATVGTGKLRFSGGQVDPTADVVTINTTPTGADPLAVSLDFSSGVTSFSGGTTSTIRTAAVDGHGSGTLSSVTVDSNGVLQLAYSNNQTIALGAVALAEFRDPQQLQRQSGGLFTNPHGAQFQLTASGVNGAGTIVSHEIEQSNVNLTDAFGDLILIQRGYQAASQVVSVTNDMIQELFGIRGRG